MSLLADYFKELGVKEILEDERGFATYYFIDNDGCYVEDIFVAPAYRDQGVAKEMLDKITLLAKDKGYLKLYGSCAVTSKKATEALQAALSYGFKLHSCRNNLIIYFKEI